MEEQCFYCEYEIEGGRRHHVTFLRNQEEQEKTLCETCYAEWLQGIKG